MVLLIELKGLSIQPLSPRKGYVCMENTGATSGEDQWLCPALQLGVSASCA